MDERVVKFRVGVMVLATLLTGGILVMLFGDARSFTRGSYTITIHFHDAPGVTDGTPVRKSGILIGRVTHVSFADQGGVNVKVKIDGNVSLYRDEVPQVSGSLLGGDVVIQFVRRSKLPAEPSPSDVETKKSAGAAGDTTVLTAAADGQPPGAPPLPERASGVIQPDDYIEGSVAPNAFQVISNLEDEMGKAIGSLSSAGDEVGKLAASVNRILADNDDQINRIVNKTETTIDSFQKALNNIDDVLGDPKVREKIKDTINELPELLSDTRETVVTMRTTVESVDRNLRNMEGFTGPLGERGSQIVERVDQAVARLDDLLGEMSDFGRKLNRGEGSLGQLMRNPDLYQHLNAAAKNIECLTRDLKPILADARVFSDKIARDPGVLGVRGALQKSPGTKWPAPLMRNDMIQYGQ